MEHNIKPKILEGDVSIGELLDLDTEEWEDYELEDMDEYLYEDEDLEEDDILSGF